MRKALDGYAATKDWRDKGLPRSPAKNAGRVNVTSRVSRWHIVVVVSAAIGADGVHVDQPLLIVDLGD
jgi:hypothetical protein